MPKTNTGIRPVPEINACLRKERIAGQALNPGLQHSRAGLIQEQPHPYNLTMQQKEIIRRK